MNFKNVWVGFYLGFLEVMHRMAFKCLCKNSSPSHILLNWQINCGCFPPLQNELFMQTTYNITTTFSWQASLKIFTCLINMHSSHHNFSDIISRSPYDLGNVHLVCANICRHNNKQQHYFWRSSFECFY